MGKLISEDQPFAVSITIGNDFKYSEVITQDALLNEHPAFRTEDAIKRIYKKAMAEFYLLNKDD